MQNWYKKAQIAESNAQDLDVAPTSVHDVNSFSKELLRYLYKNLKAKGYDIRGVQDMVEMIEKATDRGYDILEKHEDWRDSLQKAKDSVAGRKSIIKERKLQQESTQYIDWKRIKEL